MPPIPLRKTLHDDPPADGSCRNDHARNRLERHFFVAAERRSREAALILQRKVLSRAAAASGMIANQEPPGMVVCPVGARENSPAIYRWVQDGAPGDKSRRDG